MDCFSKDAELDAGALGQLAELPVEKPHGGDFRGAKRKRPLRTTGSKKSRGGQGQGQSQHTKHRLNANADADAGAIRGLVVAKKLPPTVNRVELSRVTLV